MAMSAPRRGWRGSNVLICFVVLAAVATVLSWGREQSLLHGLSSVVGAAGLVAQGTIRNGGEGADGAWGELRALFRRWYRKGEDADAEADEGEVSVAIDSTVDPPGGDVAAGSDGPQATATDDYGEGGADSSPSGTVRPEAMTQRQRWAELDYYGPPSLGGAPDPNEERWLLKPPRKGVDIQIRRDLSPWRRGGITLNELRLQKAGKAKLKIANDTVWNQPTGLFSCVIWRNVPYFYVSEVRYILSHFIYGAVLKILEFLRLLFSVGKFTRLPNTVFLWNADPWPLLKGKPQHSAEAPRPSAPVFSLCKTDGDWDVLYPSMYFKTKEFWERVIGSIGGASKANPWRGRVARMWWRGSAGKFWPGSAPRLMAVGSYHTRPWADFAITGQWEWSLEHWPGTPVWDSLPADIATVRYGKEHSMTMEEVAKYKYSLHLPGFYYATYSRMLQFLLWSGSTVFVYDCPYYEFYYHRLKPWTHYIPTNLSMLPARHAWAEAHPDAAEEIAASGRALAASRLGKSNFVSYWGQLLKEYNRLLGFKLDPPPKGLCTCWPGGLAPEGGRPGKPAPSWVLPGTRHCGVLCSDRLIVKTGLKTTDAKRRRRR